MKRAEQVEMVERREVVPSLAEFTTKVLVIY